MKTYCQDPKTGKVDEIIDMVMVNGVYRMAEEPDFPKERNGCTMMQASWKKRLAQIVIEAPDVKGAGIERRLNSYKAAESVQKGHLIDIFA